MEFLVVGDPANPCAAVDLTGWVFDDNGGDFESCGTGVGIAPGHYRFTACYNAVLPGAILVVYNAADPYIGMPADDPTDADGDQVYIIPSTSTCLEANYLVPNSIPATCTYSGPYSAPTTTWAAGMANSGDVAQVLKPDYSFFHGMSFSNVNTLYPSWPSGADAGTSFNKGSGNLALDCGSFWKSSSFISTSAGSGTPGAGNTSNNINMINNIRNCTFNYADLDDPDNCTLLLPLHTGPLRLAVHDQAIDLTWKDYTLEPGTQAIIYHSTNGETFYAIAELGSDDYAAQSPDHIYTDIQPATGNNYYWVEFTSDEKEINYKTNTESAYYSPYGISVYPNPITDQIHISGITSGATIYLLDATGKKVTEVTSEDEIHSIPVSTIPPGQYFLYIILQHSVAVFPLIK